MFVDPITGVLTVRSTPEERAMRYSAVCTLMLADQVEDLEEGNESSTKKIAEVKGSMGALVVQQAKLNNKVKIGRAHV